MPEWEGAKSRGDDCKLLYFASNGTSNERNGVATAVAERFRDRISLVEQVSDCLMAIRIHISNKAMNVVTAYASQTECNNDDKDGL